MQAHLGPDRSKVAAIRWVSPVDRFLSLALPFALLLRLLGIDLYVIIEGGPTQFRLLRKLHRLGSLVGQDRGHSRVCVPLKFDELIA